MPRFQTIGRRRSSSASRFLLWPQLAKKRAAAGAAQPIANHRAGSSDALRLVEALDFDAATAREPSRHLTRKDRVVTVAIGIFSAFAIAFILVRASCKRGRYLAAVSW